ncbi:peptidylprolyl isomerase [Sphingomonas colocasiae]|uniref:peptidylprolyl isomerase n=1 Tax=Sphingomonas colocasiae TaxID=1848973 RepID=A0ABS7PXB4_9SPHN|nr:peptidylprolyl isomerase [Sphingomonas colocasiae]MBY8825999.1 peptidylprolyl isomerase [Sphingomonas colocasiae]
MSGLFRVLIGLLLALSAFPANAAGPATARVRIETSLGAIVVEVDLKRAPVTSANFLAYAEEKRFDGTTFYRAARNKGDPTRGLIQGGIDSKVRKARWPIDHEPTSKTGLRHVDGTLSMARNAPGSAMGDFFITIGPSAYLDARDGSPGYAAFGRVVSGMAIVHRILALPTWPGGRSITTKGQHIKQPIRIISVRRIR